MSKVAVVRFPGTNNEYETIRALKSFNIDAQLVESFETNKIKEYDAFWLAGGFSYGDVLRAGAIASASDFMRELKGTSVPIIGSCNGFQILTETNMLPGALLPNKTTRFISKWIRLTVVESNSFLDSIAGQIIKIPIAHFEGNYYHPDIAHIKNQVSFKYCNEKGETTIEANPNGSLDNIAGIVDAKKSIIGLMPHPERASFAHQGSTDGRLIIESFLKEVKQ